MTIKTPKNLTIPQVKEKDFKRIYRMGYQAAFDRLSEILHPKDHDRPIRCFCEICQGHELIRDNCECATCIALEMFSREIKLGIKAKSKYVPDPN